ncbi:MAG: hypothetical protein K1W26_11545, partial [Acetatifactor sp.]
PQNMNFSRYYRNRGKFIYGFDPNIILWLMNFMADVGYYFSNIAERALFLFSLPHIIMAEKFWDRIF